MSEFREQPKRPIPPLIHSSWGVIYPFKLKMPLHTVINTSSVSGILQAGCTSVGCAEVINYYFLTGQLDGTKTYTVKRSNNKSKIYTHTDTSKVSKDIMNTDKDITFNPNNHLNYYNYYIIGDNNPTNKFWGRKFDEELGEYIPLNEKLKDITNFIFNMTMSISIDIGKSNLGLATSGKQEYLKYNTGNYLGKTFNTYCPNYYYGNTFTSTGDTNIMRFLELEEILYKVAELGYVSVAGGVGDGKNIGHAYNSSGFDLGMLFVSMGWCGRFNGFKNITRHSMDIPVGNNNINYSGTYLPDYNPIFPSLKDYDNVILKYIKNISLREYLTDNSKPNIEFNKFTLTNGLEITGELINGYVGIELYISLKIKNTKLKGLILSDYTLFKYIKVATTEGESDLTIINQTVKLKLKPLEEVICNFTFTPTTTGKFRIVYPWNTSLNKDINIVSLGSVARPTLAFNNFQNVSYTTKGSDNIITNYIWGDRVSYQILISQKRFNTLGEIHTWIRYSGYLEYYNTTGYDSGKENSEKREDGKERGACNRFVHIAKILNGDAGRSNISFFDNTIPYNKAVTLLMTDGYRKVYTKVQKLRAVSYYTRNSEKVIPGETIETVTDETTTYSVDENTCYNNINITIPATALAVDFSKIKSTININNINLSAVKNPNVIFYVNNSSNLQALRSKLIQEERNVVIFDSTNGDKLDVVSQDPKYYTADVIKIDSNYDFYVPFTFVANNVYFNVKFDEGSSKNNVKYKGIPFIFNVSKVECEGTEINWFGSNIENNNNRFWVKELLEIHAESDSVTGYLKLMSKEFTCEFRTAPEIKLYSNYFIAVPGKSYGLYDLEGKTLTFYGQNLTLHGSLYIDDISYKVNSDFEVERTYRTGQSGQEASFRVYDAENFKQVTSILDVCGTTHKRKESNIYKLSSDGSKFIHYNNSTDIKPFETYFKDFDRRPYIDEDLS